MRPNGGAYAGAALYTDSLVALRAATGKLLWYDQVRKHDVRDYDFEASPIVVGRRVYGAGKAGRVVAWNRLTGKRMWSQSVGTHLHDLGPLPVAWTTRLPRALGRCPDADVICRRAPLRSGRGPLHAGKRRAHACAQ